MATTLEEYELAARTYKMLGRLRYQGPPYRMSAGQLAESMGLSSGAMTNRLDRLEQAGLVRRLDDPDDRRAVLVEPTEAGLAAWDRAVGTQAEREARIASALSEDEKKQLHDLLRRLMVAFPQETRAAALKHKLKPELPKRARPPAATDGWDSSHGAHRRATRADADPAAEAAP